MRADLHSVLERDDGNNKADVYKLNGGGSSFSLICCAK
jgi:hypothetical protein